MQRAAFCTVLALALFAANANPAWAVIDIAATSQLVPSDTQPRGAIVGVNTRIENLGDEVSPVTIVALLPPFGGSPLLTDYLLPLPALDTCPRRLPCEAGDQCMDIGALSAGASRDCTFYYRVRQDAPSQFLGIRATGGPIVGSDVDWSNNTTIMFLQIIDAQPVPSLSPLSWFVLALGIALIAARRQYQTSV